MNDLFFRQPFRILMIAVISLALAGCGQGMSGKYVNEMMEVEFKSSSKAYITIGMEGVSRTTTEAKYEVQGDKIIVHNQGGNLVLTLNKDGTLSGGPMEAIAGPLRKQSDSAGSANSVASAERSRPAARVSGVEREGQDAVLAEIGNHCLKGPDGSWITLVTAGSPYAPEHFYRQFRELTVESVDSVDLSEADRMNGFEWAGEVTFKRTPCREIGDRGVSSVLGMIERRPDQWTQWTDFQPTPVSVQKVKGKWQVRPHMGLLEGDELLSGVLPPASVFADVK